VLGAFVFSAIALVLTTVVSIYTFKQSRACFGAHGGATKGWVLALVQLFMLIVAQKNG